MKFSWFWQILRIYYSKEHNNGLGTDTLRVLSNGSVDAKALVDKKKIRCCQSLLLSWYSSTENI